MSSDRVYRWRLLLEEYGPEIIYIKGIDNTVADAISRLLFSKPAQTPMEEQQNWMIRTKCWCKTKQSHKKQQRPKYSTMFLHIVKTTRRYFPSLLMKLQPHKRRIDQSKKINKHTNVS